MSNFTCACGYKFQHENDGQFQRVLIQRIYSPDSGQEDILMQDKCKNCNEKKIEKPITLLNHKTGQTYRAKDTYCLAKNIDFKERKLVDYYDAELEAKQTIEIVFQIENWRKIITKTINTHNCSMVDLIDTIIEEIWDEIVDDEYGEGYMYMTSTDGDYDSICIESEDMLKNMIVSLRVVGFDVRGDSYETENNNSAQTQ